MIFMSSNFVWMTPTVGCAHPYCKALDQLRIDGRTGLIRLNLRLLNIYLHHSLCILVFDPFAVYIPGQSVSMYSLRRQTHFVAQIALS
jgi:hypothetical protein